MRNNVLIVVLLALIGVIAGAAYFLTRDDTETAGEQDLADEYQPPEELPVIEEQYDVVVLGGEPEGVAAAVSAARNGSSVLLVEHRDGLGGLMTFGMLNFIDMVQGIGGGSAVGGIFAEFHALIGGGSSFGVEEGKAAFLKLVEDEPNITLALETEFTEAIKENQTVTGVKVKNADGEFTVSAERFIDATQDADFAVKAGVPFTIGGEDINLKDRLMAVSPMIHLTGVDWDGIRRAAEEEVFGYAEVTEKVAWGFGDLHHDYPATEENTRLRGLNLVRVPGEEEQFYINALQIFGVDGLDEESKAAALEKGRRETDHVVKFLRENFPGFENAEVASYPTELYVRETRHMKAEYILQMSDIWTNADQWDSIGFGGYPVDVQATSINDYGYVLASPVQYAIPFRSLVPLKVDNIAVVSRSAGYSSLAAGSARIIPTGMAAGEAGGAAAALSIENDMTFRELSKDEAAIEELRTVLAGQGAMVEHFDIPYPYEGEWFDEAVQYLMDYGLAFGGYDNDLQVDEPLPMLALSKSLLTGLLHTNTELYEQYAEELNAVYNIENIDGLILTRDAMAEFLIETFTEETVREDVWHQALELGLIDDVLYERLDEDQELTRADGYYVSYWVLNKLNGETE